MFLYSLLLLQFLVVFNYCCLTNSSYDFFILKVVSVFIQTSISMFFSFVLHANLYPLSFAYYFMVSSIIIGCLSDFFHYFFSVFPIFFLYCWLLNSELSFYYFYYWKCVFTPKYRLYRCFFFNIYTIFLLLLFYKYFNFIYLLLLFSSCLLHIINVIVKVTTKCKCMW